MAALDNDSDSELELEEKQFTIGAHTFQVHVVGELPLETLFALESKRDEISGQRAWPGSLLLAAEVAARPALVEDRAVVELGAGAGLCAMVAARCGARTTAATDGDDRCLDLLRRNVAGNGLEGVVSVAKCFWGRDAPPVGNLVLAGDVLYKRALVEPFLDALEAALAPGGRALLCHLPRAGVSHEVVEAALRARGRRRARAGRRPRARRRRVRRRLHRRRRGGGARLRALPAGGRRRRGRAAKSFRGPRVESRESRRSLGGPEPVPRLRRSPCVSLRPARGRSVPERRGRRRAGAAARRVGGSRDGDFSGTHGRRGSKGAIK